MKQQSYLLLGWIFVGLGAVGVFLPVMPTTVFILIAAWAFARSSPRLHRWLREHPHFGHSLRSWEDHRAMPRSAKRIALLMLGVSYLTTATLLGPLAPGAMIAGVCIVGVVVFIMRIPILNEDGANK
ncbi:MAG: uncharacterized membrane protein YbaN (DUF454 family) [Gammaproteobacteria bacterium]|jgi:uncharacterized membrane protein YbaN (DUF454 family)